MTCGAVFSPLEIIFGKTLGNYFEINNLPLLLRDLSSDLYKNSRGSGLGIMSESGHHNRRFFSGWVILLLLTSLLLSSPVSSFAGENGLRPTGRGAIVVSRKIRPYLATLDGINDFFKQYKGIKTDIFFLPDFTEVQHSSLLNLLTDSDYSFIVAVGPEAAQFLKHDSLPSSLPRVINTMLLNPEKILGPAPCGVFLNIPVKRQIESIKQVLPGSKKIGILYNPVHNADFLKQAIKEGQALDLEIIPLTISETNKIADVLEKNWDQIEALWFIPDATVISKTIVRHIIKEAFIHHIPAIGYNRFFYDSGAVLSFSFDYITLGSQAAALVIAHLNGLPCRNREPFFKLITNTRVADRLGLPITATTKSGETAR